MQENTELFPTFKMFKQQAGNESASFNDYLVAYFKEKAVTPVIQGIDGQISKFSRITNDLTTIHPQLTNKDVGQQFMSTVNSMSEESDPQKRQFLFKRWFLAELNIITHLFLDRSGRLKKRFLETLVGNRFPNTQAVKQALYGEPENILKVNEFGQQVIASAALAIASILSVDPEILKHDEYRERAAERPEDDIGIKKFSEMLLTYKDLRYFFMADPDLCKIEALRIQKHFLITMNNLLPANQQDQNMASDLNVLFDKVILLSPNITSEEFQGAYALCLGFINKYAITMSEKSLLQEAFKEYMTLRYECYGILLKEKNPQRRVDALTIFETRSNQLIYEATAQLAPSSSQSGPGRG